MRFDPARLALLTQPSAWLAGHLMAVPVQLPSGEPPLLLQGQHSLRVVDGCSGADFFGLLAGLLLWVTLSRRPRLAWLVLPVAYVLTVGANAGRLAAILVMESNLSPHVPIYLHGSLHAATGIAVFLPLMIVTYAACERMVCDDRRLL
jgi:exosortase/archaeosortase family protein